MVIDLVTEYKGLVDEAFTVESKKSIITNNDYSWTGAKSIKVYKMSTSNMNDYDRPGTGANKSRYGEVESLSATTQEMMLRRDRSFTFAIDKLDEDETARALTASTALARQIREVVIPEVDQWTYNEMCLNAGLPLIISIPSIGARPPQNTIYNMIALANQLLDEHFVPETNRFLLVSPTTYADLKKDAQVIMNTDIAQEMRLKGVIGYIDGLSVIKVPSSRLPSDFLFLAGHPSACVAPVKLEDYKIHADPPGISGALVEGRINYDAFVLDNKSKGLVYASLEVTSP